MIIGYKTFNPDGTTRYGDKLEIWKLYTVSGIIHTRFGDDRNNGYHYCKDIGAVFRFFDFDNGVEPKIARIIASGDTDRVEDLTGDYETFASRSIILEKWLTHEEIVDTVLASISSIRLALLCNNFVLYGDEKYRLLDRVKGDSGLTKAVLYYKFGYKNIYYLDYDEEKELIKTKMKRLEENKGKSKTLFNKNN